MAGQVALSFLLLIFARLALRSFHNAGFIDPGFNPKNLVVAQVLPILSGYNEPRGRALLDEMLSPTRNLPGVQSAGMTTNLPLTLSIGVQRFALEGEEQGSESRRHLFDSSNVSPGYFATMGIPFVEGRDFSEADRQRTTKYAIVNAALAKRFWPDRTAIGHKINLIADNGSLIPLEIVGVVKDGKYRTLGEDSRPFVYGSLVQNYAGGGILVARAAGDMQPVLSGIRDIVRALDADMPVISLMPMTERIDSLSVTSPRNAKKLQKIARQADGQLTVWQKSHELTLLIYELTASFPREEVYGLTAQMRRAASSIAANIAEGCGGDGDVELARYCRMARACASELEYHFLLARDLIPDYGTLRAPE
jgi:four helix bundle protein